MNLDYLDFEQPIAELEGKIQALCNIQDKADIAKEMEALKSKSTVLTKKIFSSLSDWQISQLARHPQRLYTLDYINDVFDEFTELHGDRAYADDHAIIGGIAKLDGKPVMFIGQQKGRSTQDKIKFNFGMPRPEGYRKALRLMKMAEKFSMRIYQRVCMISILLLFQIWRICTSFTERISLSRLQEILYTICHW